MTRILLAIALILVTALGWSLWRAEAHKGNAEAAEVAQKAAEDRAAALQTQLDDVNAVLTTERARVEDMARLATETEEELSNAQDRADRLAADLAAGRVRVRHEIAALHTARLSTESATRRELEAAAQRGSELVAAAVGVGARCDAVQQGLIRAYEATRTEQEKPRR